MHDILLMASLPTGYAIGVAATCYAAAAALMIFYLRKQALSPLRALLALLLPGIAAHAAALWQQIETPTGFYFGFFAASSLVVLIMTTLVTLSAIRLPVQNLLLLILPVSIATLIGSITVKTSFEPIVELDAALLTHILLSVAAYSILFTAACQALVQSYQEGVLRRRHDMVVLRLLPPLETMEALLFTLLWAGVVTLTLAIASGFAFLDDMFAQHVVHHTILSLASWVLFSGLLTGHYIFGWRSYTATYGTLLAFALLLLGYFGSKFVIEIVLGR